MVTEGPYSFVSYTPGDRIEMKRNERYWGPKPEWEKVNYRYIRLTWRSARPPCLGDVDVIDKVSLSDIEKLEKNPSKVKVWSYPGLRALIMQPSFNLNPSKFLTDKAGKPLDKNPLLDVRVRKALNMAINREAIADRAARGGVTAAT